MTRNSFFDIITVISTSKKHKTFYIIVLYTLLILIDDFAETLNLMKSCSLDPYPTIPPLYSYDIPLISLSTLHAAAAPPPLSISTGTTDDLRRGSRGCARICAAIACRYS